MKTSIAVLLALIATSFLYQGHASAGLATSFRYPVGDEDGSGWLLNVNGLQWLEEYDYGGSCGVVFHPGTDFNKDGTSEDQDLGEPVYAVADGEILESYYEGSSSWGNIILIRHELSTGEIVLSQYGHLNDRYVSSGTVSKGDLIGTVGKGDGSLFAHLHFEIRKSSMESSLAKYLPCGESQDFVLAHYYDPTDFLDSHSGLEACWLAEVISFDQPEGSSNDGGPPEAALGNNDGAYVSIDIPETLILGFGPYTVLDRLGDDIHVYQHWAGDSHVDIYVSYDNVDYVYLGMTDGDVSYDLESFGIEGVNFIKFVGLDDGGAYDGYDLDAVQSPYCLSACTDSDGDGYGNPAHPECTHPELDCNNSNPHIYPTNPNTYCDCEEPYPQGVAEICDDGIDNDCDGLTDVDDPDCVGQLILEMDPVYDAGTLSLDFLLGTPDPAVWATYLIVLTISPVVVPLWQAPLPGIVPAVDIPIAFPCPSLGLLGIYTCLYDSGGVQAYDLEWVDTGLPD